MSTHGTPVNSGEQHGNAKLTNRQVARLRALANLRCRECNKRIHTSESLAAEFGICTAYVSELVNYRWRASHKQKTLDEIVAQSFK